MGGDGADADQAYALWPENWPVWCLWRDVETQWRTRMAGATGLDYAAVWTLVEQRMRRRRERKTAFWLLQAMEEAALHEWAEQRRREDGNR